MISKLGRRGSVYPRLDKRDCPFCFSVRFVFLEGFYREDLADHASFEMVFLVVEIAVSSIPCISSHSL